MGHFDGICTLTNLPIVEGDLCVQVVLKNTTRYNYCGPEHVFRGTIDLHLGKYAGYGVVCELQNEEKSFPILFRLSSWHWMTHLFSHLFSKQKEIFTQWMSYTDIQKSQYKLAEEWFIVVQAMTIFLGKNILGAIDTQTQMAHERLDNQEQLLDFIFNEIRYERKRIEITL